MVVKLMKWHGASAYNVLETVGLNLFADISYVFLYQCMSPEGDAYKMEDSWFLHVQTERGNKAELKLTDKAVVDSLLSIQ